MRPSVRTPLVTVAAAAALAAGAGLLPSVASAEDSSGAERGSTQSAKVVGLLTDGTTLVSFKASGTDRVKSLSAVTLSSPDTKLVGIDWRVQDAGVYGVGNGGGVYKVTVADGVASAALVNRLTVALDPAATRFGVDFNPVADRLRVVSSTGQNLRHNVNAGGVTIADTPLSAPGAVAAAYTNNDASAATATTLFDLSPAGGVVVQSPANSGQLAAVGSLGLGPTSDAAFDIRTKVDEDRTVNLGFAAATVGGTRNLYTVDVLSGAATLVGPIAAAVDDLTVVGS
jgi:hypothetical protein